MKKIFLLLLLLYTQPLICQNTLLDSIHQFKVELVRLCELSNSGQQVIEDYRSVDSIILLLYRKLDDNLFTSDLAFIDTFNTINNYLLQGNCLFYCDTFVKENFTGYFNTYFNEFSVFNYSIGYNDIPKLYLIDSLLKDDASILLQKIFLDYNVSQLIALYDNSNCSTKVKYINSYIPNSIEGLNIKRNFIEADIIHNSLCEKVLITYLMLLNGVKKNVINGDSLIDHYILYFKNNYDTTNADNKFIINFIEDRNIPPIATKSQWQIDLDSIESRNDSLNQLETQNEINLIMENVDISNLSQMKKQALEFILQQENPLLHILDTSKMSPEQKLQFIIKLDTTLNSNEGHWHGASGDDGKRFDTMTNAQLFDHLALFDYNQITDTLITEYDLNTDPNIIHLRKITQLIGDRIITGALVMDTSQNQEVNRLLTFCEQVLGLDTSRAWKKECFELVFRIYWPFKPMLKSWLTSNNEHLASYSDRYLHQFMDETMARELVQLSEDAFDAGNRSLAERYMSPLQIIDSKRVPDNRNMPPRRFEARTFDESTRWCEEFILPGMVKLGWRVEVK